MRLVLVFAGALQFFPPLLLNFSGLSRAEESFVPYRAPSLRSSSAKLGAVCAAFNRLCLQAGVGARRKRTFLSAAFSTQIEICYIIRHIVSEASHYDAAK